MIEIDLLVKNVKELVNPASDEVVRGRSLNSIRISRDLWIGSTGEIVTFLGFEEEFNKECVLKDNAVVIDGSGYIAFPGFVDPHTHLPFAETRQDEFRQKLQGVSYQEIAAKGGGKYIRANNTRLGLNALFEDINQLEKKEIEAKIYSEYQDMFQYPAALALLLIIIEYLILDRKNRRLKHIRLFKVENK